jgi:hypothetical protein
MMINGRNVRLFGSMYDYVEDADFRYYVIQDGKIRKTPFVEAVKPSEDSNFIISTDDQIMYEGNAYTKVNFGEFDDEETGESFMLDSAISEEVFLIYNKIKGKEATYGANAACYRTEELAYLSGKLEE